MMRRRKEAITLAVSVCLLLSASCYRPLPHPNLPRIFAPQATIRRVNKPPVIVIPGMLGSRLVNRRTNETIWPQLVVDSKALALPIAAPSLAENTDDLAATEILDAAKLNFLLPEIHLYDTLLEALERYGGYRRGQFDNPPPDGDRDTFYVFPYDWRRDLSESARLLGRQIAALKQRLGRPELRFDVVGHSAGGLVARYWAMYGDHDVLAESAPQPDWSGARDFARLVLIATPNAGSMSAFRTLLEGYSAARTKRLPIGFLDKLKNKLPLADFSPNVAFASPSIYQMMPPPAHVRFFDAELKPLAVDLYDVKSWRRFGWSVAFEKGQQARQSNNKQPTTANHQTTIEQVAQERFIGLALQRAQEFQRALAAPHLPPATLRFFLIGGDCYHTLNAAMIVTHNAQAPRTLFLPEQITRDKSRWEPIIDALYAPGDGSTTRHSLFGQPLAEPTAEAVAPSLRSTTVWTAFFCDGHAGLPLNPTLQNNLLTALLVNQP